MVKMRYKKRTERVIRAIEDEDIKKVIECLKSKQELTAEQIAFVQTHPRMLSNALVYHRMGFKVRRQDDGTVVVEAGSTKGLNIPGVVRERIAGIGSDSRELTNRQLRRKIAHPEKRLAMVAPIMLEADLMVFYESWDWKRLRYRALQKFGRRCLACNATAGDGAKIVVDHIKPIRRYWHLRLDPENLQPLCEDCNMGKGSWDETDFRVTV